MDRLERRVRWLIWLNVLSLASVGFLLFVLFSGRGNISLAAVTAKRVDVVGPDGRPILALAHRTAIPGPSMNGRSYPADVIDSRTLLSGMIFFNDQGDEVGGLVYNGITGGRDTLRSGTSRLINGSRTRSWPSSTTTTDVLDVPASTSGTARRIASMDQELDLLQRIRQTEGEERDSLISIHSGAQADGDYGVQRLFVGSQDETAQLELRDTAGRMRARLRVDAEGDARLEFLDESGAVLARYPGEQSGGSAS